jgi:hypothetical protein
MKRPTLAGLLLIAGCASTPTGPTVQVMPAPGRTLSLFADDDTVCRHYAAGQVDGEAAKANWMQAAIAGSGLGAAIGGGQGAAIGPGAGALGGTAVSAIPAGKAQTTLQDRYDMAYGQCQITHGNQVPGFTKRGRL